MGMKIEIVRTMLIPQRVINVIEQKLEVLTTFVCQHDSHTTPERHGDVAVETSSLRAGKQGGLKRDHASKKSPKGALKAGFVAPSQNISIFRPLSMAGLRSLIVAPRFFVPYR